MKSDTGLQIWIDSLGCKLRNTIAIFVTATVKEYMTQPQIIPVPNWQKSNVYI